MNTTAMNKTANPEFTEVTFNGYTFTVVKDHRGYRLGSVPSIRDFSVQELTNYANALRKLDTFVYDMCTAWLLK